VKYSWVNWLKRWEVEGPRTGWFMTFRAVSTPVAKVTITNTWDGVVAAAKAAGAKFPDVVAAQWALESGYGKHTSGKNNYFGIKGEGSDRETKEFINGQWISIVDGFIDFPDLQTCVTYLVDRWYRDYQRFKGVNRAGSPEECARLLVAEGYATDPQYSDKLIKLMRENG
jgi:flagellum-specific peptidoglycan hydrolase FlgJ